MIYRVLLNLLFCLLLSGMQFIIAADEISLNGTWQIIFDLQNKGRDKKWQFKENFDRYYNVRNIKVPSCWETIELDYEGVAWYGRSFSIPADWKERTIRVRFGAVNYRAEVWINGEPAGYHDGGYTPFELEIGDLLLPDGDNFIALRVTGPIVNKDIVVDGFGRDDTPHWRGAITGGIWQDVKLVATGQVFVKNIFIEPDIQKNTAKVKVTLQNSGTRNFDLLQSFTISPKVQPELKTASKNQVSEIPPGESEITLVLPVKNARYWSPDDPFLYELNLALDYQGKLFDKVRIAFGMREFNLKNDDFYLNGKKIYLKTGFWEGFYPNTLAYPENEEIIRKEFKYAKEIGFNCLRPWRKQVPPITLELADELGVLIIASPAIECMGQWPTATPFMKERIFNEFTEMVLRDRNHPSVICWELYNEIHRNALGRLKHKTAVLVRGLDPSRLIIDESGGWFGGSHAYVPYSMEPIVINEIHSYKPAPVSSNTYIEFRNMGKTPEELSKLGLKPAGGKNNITPGKLLFISEIGYGSLPDIDSNMITYETTGNPLTPDYRFTRRLQQSLNEVIDELDIRNIFPTVSDFCQATQEIQAIANKIQLEAVRINPLFDGYCVHAYTDGDWVLGAGVLDVFRNKKKTFNTIKEINAPLYLAVGSSNQLLDEGEKAEIEITAVNESGPLKGTLNIKLKDDAGTENVILNDPLSIPGGINKVFSGSEILNPGLNTIIAKFISENGIVTENSYPIRVFRKENLKLKNRIAVVNPQPRLRTFLKDQDVDFTEEFGTGGDIKTVVVGNIDTSTYNLKERLLKVLDFARNGGTVVYLNPVNIAPRGNATLNYKNQYLPFPMDVKNATGHWVSVGHVIKDHSVFKGLPSRQLMGQEYQNVCAVKTFCTIENIEETIVGSISWDIGKPEMWNYTGPLEAWWGNDLVVAPYGKGKVVLSSLRIAENLDNDPVARRLLQNIIEWTDSL